MVVAGNRCARVPCALDAQVADIEWLTAFVGQRLLEPQNHVDRSETIGQEGFRVCAEQCRVERRDVRLETADGLLDFQAVAIHVAVRNVVTVAVVETQVGAIRLNLGQGNDTGVRRQGRHHLAMQRTLEVRAFEDHIDQTAVRGFRT